MIAPATMVHTALRWSQAKLDQPKNRKKNDYRPIDSNSRKGYTLIANFGSDVSFCVISQSRTARPGSRGSKEAAGPLLSISSVFGCVVFFPHSTHTQIGMEVSEASRLGCVGRRLFFSPIDSETLKKKKFKISADSINSTCCSGVTTQQHAIDQRFGRARAGRTRQFSASRPSE